MTNWKACRLGLLTLLLPVLCAEAATPGYQKLREVTSDDRSLAGKINFSPVSVVSSPGTYSNPPWSAESAASGEAIPPPAGLVNKHPRRGWMSPKFDAVDPENPYLMLEFPYDRPVVIDTIGLYYNFKKSPEYRPTYSIERRLNGEWMELLTPQTLEDALRPLWQLDTPVECEALRIRFYEQSPANCWTVERFWAYGPEAQEAAYLGQGTLSFAQDKQIFQPGIAISNRVTFESDAALPDKDVTLTVKLTDYYRTELQEVATFPLNLAKGGSFEVMLGALPPQAYFLTAEVTDGTRTLERTRTLFGVAGVSENQIDYAAIRADLPSPKVEIAGAVGQYDGLEQRKSRDTVDAFANVNVNTMQLEFFWGDLEPLPGVYNFAELDALVNYVTAKDLFFNVTLYFADDQTPEWLRTDEYVMLDQYGKPATGRNFWKMIFFAPPSVSSPLFQEHFAVLWGKIAERCAPTHRMLRADIRPPLLEVFFFDEYTNLYVNGGKTDNVWDYSEWARLDFINYLRDYKSMTLDEVKQRYELKLNDWNELQLPQPLSLAERKSDRRAIWLDFMEFKLGYTQQYFYWNAIREIVKYQPNIQFFASEAKIDDSPIGRELARYAESGQLCFGNFSIEQAREYFQFDQYRYQPKTICFEWGEPAPSFSSYTAGLFSILPLLPHGTLRWVGAPAMEEKAYASPVTYRSWQDFRILAPKLGEVADYKLIDDSEIALVGGFNHDNGEYENNRPTRRIRKSTQFDRCVINNWGGLSGVLKASLYYNGLPPFYEMTARTPEGKLDAVKLLIDSGHPDNPLSVQQAALDFVANGGKLILWSNSFRKENGAATTEMRRKLGLVDVEHPEFQEEPRGFSMSFPGGQKFTSSLYRIDPAVKVTHGTVIGHDEAGTPIAWEIPYGAGKVIFINGLPVIDAADEWVPWMRDLMAYAGVREQFAVAMESKEQKLPSLFTYTLRNPETQELLIVFWNYSPATAVGKVTYHDLGITADWSIEKFHSNIKDTQVRFWNVTDAGCEFNLLMASMDLLIVKATPPAEQK